MNFPNHPVHFFRPKGTTTREPTTGDSPLDENHLYVSVLGSAGTTTSTKVGLVTWLWTRREN